MNIGQLMTAWQIQDYRIEYATLHDGVKNLDNYSITKVTVTKAKNNDIAELIVKFINDRPTKLIHASIYYTRWVELEKPKIFIDDANLGQLEKWM